MKKRDRYVIIGLSVLLNLISISLAVYKIILKTNTMDMWIIISLSLAILGVLFTQAIMVYQEKDPYIEKLKDIYETISELEIINNPSSGYYSQIVDKLLIKIKSYDRILNKFNIKTTIYYFIDKRPQIENKQDDLYGYSHSYYANWDMNIWKDIINETINIKNQINSILKKET